MAILTLSLHICKEIQSLQICELEKFTYYWSSNENNVMYSDLGFSKASICLLFNSYYLRSLKISLLDKQRRCCCNPKTSEKTKQAWKCKVEVVAGYPRKCQWRSRRKSDHNKCKHQGMAPSAITEYSWHNMSHVR